jgi:hypothetical protein
MDSKNLPDTLNQCNLIVKKQDLLRQLIMDNPKPRETDIDVQRLVDNLK